MKINNQTHGQAKGELEKRESLAIGVRQLIQLYASELDLHQLLEDSFLEAFNWDYFETILKQQLDIHPTSAVHEANQTYFEALKEEFQSIQKG